MWNTCSNAVRFDWLMCLCIFVSVPPTHSQSIGSRKLNLHMATGCHSFIYPYIYIYIYVNTYKSVDLIFLFSQTSIAPATMELMLHHHHQARTSLS